MGYSYNIPYSSVTERNLYQREYYKLSKNKKKNKYIKSGDYTKDKINNNKQSNHNLLMTYDKEGILKETEDYILSQEIDILKVVPIKKNIIVIVVLWVDMKNVN